MNTVVGVLLVVLGAVGTARFRQVADWFDRAKRTLADGPGASEPKERSVVGQWLMVGTGSSVSARWYRYGSTLLTSVFLLVVGAGNLLGAWQLLT
jgi:hypothetical protein